MIMLDFDVGPVLAPVRCRPPCIVFALSKRTDVYVSAACRKASGSNPINARAVPVPTEIGSSPSFVGSAGAARGQRAGAESDIFTGAYRSENRPHPPTFTSTGAPF